MALALPVGERRLRHVAVSWAALRQVRPTINYLGVVPKLKHKGLRKLKRGRGTFFCCRPNKCAADQRHHECPNHTCQVGVRCTPVTGTVPSTKSKLHVKAGHHVIDVGAHAIQVRSPTGSDLRIYYRQLEAETALAWSLLSAQL